MRDSKVVAAVFGKSFLMQWFEDGLTYSLHHILMIYTSLHCFHKIFSPFSPDSFSISTVTLSDSGALLFFNFDTVCLI